MTGKSLTPNEILLSQLKELMPQAFNEGKLDKEKLLASLGENIDISNERYVLNWAGKSDCFRVLQAPSTRTLVPVKEESVNFDETENIFIEGENLEVLKILQKSYFGKIKMIYIDPPYNTGNDSFIYPDKFSEGKDEYLKRVGDKDEEGYMTREGMFRKNSKENGQYHSNWLSMMYPRLFLARNLLRDDGVIFISIDDNEVHNLRLLMNEIFGEENVICTFVWKRRQNVDSRSKNGVSVDHEYVLVYGKNNSKLQGSEKDLAKYSNPDNDPRGDWMSADMTGLATKDQRPNLHYDLINPKTKINYGCPTTGWRYEPKRMMQLISNEEVIFPKNPEGRPRRKKFLSDLQSEFTGKSSILNTAFNTNATRELRELFDNKDFFDFPKPTDLVQEIITQVSSNMENSEIEKDIILDFFSGSATTAHAIFNMNFNNKTKRKFILVQLPELTPTKSDAFINGYKSIADIGKDRIRRVIKKIQQEQNENLNFKDNTLDLGFKVLKLADSSFKQWRTDIKTEDDLKSQMKLFTDPTREGSTALDMVYELILKSGKDINSSIVHKNNVYYINETEMAILIEKVDGKTIDVLIEKHPDKVIILDKLFKGNDSLKTNTALQMKDAGIEFKTI